MWCASIPLFAIATVMFIVFMFEITVSHMIQALVSIAIATCFYFVLTKKTTHKKGYTAIQAVIFYLACRKEGLGKIEMCKKKTVRFREIAETFSFAENLELDDLYEMHQIAYEILYERRSNK